MQQVSRSHSYLLTHVRACCCSCAGRPAASRATFSRRTTHQAPRTNACRAPTCHRTVSCHRTVHHTVAWCAACNGRMVHTPRSTPPRLTPCWPLTALAAPPHRAAHAQAVGPHGLPGVGVPREGGCQRLLARGPRLLGGCRRRRGGRSGRRRVAGRDAASGRGGPAADGAGGLAGGTVEQGSGPTH